MKPTSRWLRGVREVLAMGLAGALPQAAVAGSEAVRDVQVATPGAAAKAQSDFGLKALALVVKSRPRKNTVLSPTSLFLALAMTESGAAAGPTRDAMRHALSIPEGAGENAWHQAASTLFQTLRSAQDVELSIANAVWATLSMPLAANFVERCRELYDADAFSFDFLRPDAADIINHWVSRKTKEKIPDIVTRDMVANSSVILTNAVYFRGKWRFPFREAETQDAPFHLANGGRRTVPLMHLFLADAGAYRHGDGFEAAELPYEFSGMSLYAILPALGRDPEQALENVDIGKLLHSSEPYELDLRFPRFNMDFSADLRSQLIQMGMGKAFEHPGADFSPMGSPAFFIAKVLHKVRLEIDEKGTIAAAATAVLMGPKGAMRRFEKKVLVFDRPFGLLLCDSNTGAILFAGVVYEP